MSFSWLSQEGTRSKRQFILDAVFGLQIKFLGCNSFVFNTMYMYVNLCEVEETYVRKMK